jgi:hypothetical protein
MCHSLVLDSNGILVKCYSFDEYREAAAESHIIRLVLFLPAFALSYLSLIA